MTNICLIYSCGAHKLIYYTTSIHILFHTGLCCSLHDHEFSQHCFVRRLQRKPNQCICYFIMDSVAVFTTMNFLNTVLLGDCNRDQTCVSVICIVAPMFKYEKCKVIMRF